MKIIETILDDDDDMHDMYLGRRAAADAHLQAKVNQPREYPSKIALQEKIL